MRAIALPRTHTESVLATNRVIRNTYLLLSMTLLFVAATAAGAVALNLPHPGLIVALIGYFGLLFATTKLRNSGWGLVSVFALTGFMGYPWTVIRMKSRNRYMEALEDASVKGNIKPFAQFVLDEMNDWSPEKS